MTDNNELAEVKKELAKYSIETLQLDLASYMFAITHGKILTCICPVCRYGEKVGLVNLVELFVEELKGREKEKCMKML